MELLNLSFVFLILNFYKLLIFFFLMLIYILINFFFFIIFILGAWKIFYSKINVGYNSTNDFRSGVLSQFILLSVQSIYLLFQRYLYLVLRYLKIIEIIN